MLADHLHHLPANPARRVKRRHRLLKNHRHRRRATDEAVFPTRSGHLPEQGDPAMVNMVTAFRQQAHRQHRGDRFSRAGFAHHADNFTPANLQRDVVERVDVTAKMGKLRCKSSIDNTESLMTASLLIWDPAGREDHRQTD